jgi:hypothetical protein
MNLLNLNLHLYSNPYLNLNQNLYQYPYQLSHIGSEVGPCTCGTFWVRIMPVWERPHVDAPKVSQSVFLQRPGGKPPGRA